MKPTKKQKLKAADSEERADGKPQASRKLLFAAIAMSAASLASGFYLARLAYLNDVNSYEPDYVEDETSDEGEHEGANAPSGSVTDPLAKGSHPATEAIALNKGTEQEQEQEQEDGQVDVAGLLEFDEFLTNISGYDVYGKPTKGFLKVNLVLIYRTEPNAAEKIREHEPFMRDLFNGYLRGLSEEDVEGMGGIINLKAELLKRAKAAVGSDLPQEVLISDLIVQ